MKEVTTRLLQTLRLERDAFVWMDFNDRATGDALILVLVTRLVIQIGLGGASSLIGYAGVLLDAIVFWLIVSGIAYATGRNLLQGEGGFASVLRVVGFAYPTMVLILVTRHLTDSGVLNLLLASVWLIIIVGRGMEVIAGLDRQRAIGSAIAGILGFVIVSQIFRGLQF